MWRIYTGQYTSQTLMITIYNLCRQIDEGIQADKARALLNEILDQVVPIILAEETCLLSSIDIE